MAQTATTLEPYILKYSLHCPESMEMWHPRLVNVNSNAKKQSSSKHSSDPFNIQELTNWKTTSLLRLQPSCFYDMEYEKIIVVEVLFFLKCSFLFSKDIKML